MSTIDDIDNDLEQWRSSLPEDKQPGPLCNQYQFRKPVSGTALLWTHFLYYSFRLILARAYHQLPANHDDLSVRESRAKALQTMISMSRSVLELTPFIDVEPSTPLM